MRCTGDPHRGTLAAGWVGRVVAVLVLFSPWLLQVAGIAVELTDYVIAVIFGWFMWSASTATIASARIRSKLPALQARALARPRQARPAAVVLRVGWGRWR